MFRFSSSFLHNQIIKYKSDIEQLGQEFEQQMKDFEDEKTKLITEERAKSGRETSLMRSKLKSVTRQLGVMNTMLKEFKREQQELRISCLKLGTGIKPAVRDAVKQVNKFPVYNVVSLCILRVFQYFCEPVR